MIRALVLTILTTVSAGAAMHYPVKALVLSVDKPDCTFTASMAEIPGYMNAMVMPFQVRDVKLLSALKPGMFVDFTLAVDKNRSWAENVHERTYESLEQEPMLARRLQLLASLNKKNPLTPELVVGSAVPDFSLTDQTGRNVRLSQFTGKVVGITFIYTTCPLPDYCFRLSNNFGRLQLRFTAQMGRDLVLLSITFDPVHDTPDVLAKYASIWNADPNSWRFLTGALPEIKQVCRQFGTNFWPDEATLTHSLHTVVVDRQGRLAANFEGNQFSAGQLGDFIEMEIKRTK